MNRRRLVKRLAIALIVATIALLQHTGGNDAPARAQSTSTLSALQQGGYVIVFRHGATNRNQADTDPLNHDNITQQRQLSAKGKEQAKEIGAAFKKLNIALDKVYTSKFNRAIETGKLISDRQIITSIDLTEGGLVVSPMENERRAAALRKMASTIPVDGKNTLIITHKPNIIDAFGKDWFEVKEGESSIFKPNGSTKPVLVGRFQVTEWMAVASKSQ
jgi:phosphohistidine phosphatase SixA